MVAEDRVKQRRRGQRLIPPQSPRESLVVEVRL